MTAQELGNLPADEMTIRQRMAMEFGAASIEAVGMAGTHEGFAEVITSRVDALLHELARVR